MNKDERDDIVDHLTKSSNTMLKSLKEAGSQSELDDHIPALLHHLLMTSVETHRLLCHIATTLERIEANQ